MGTSARPRRLRIVQPLARASTVGASNRLRIATSTSKRGADAADQPRRQQRMAAKREEVVVDADALEPQHLGEQRAENLLLRRARPTPRAQTA